MIRVQLRKKSLLVSSTGSYIFVLQITLWENERVCISGSARWVRLAALLNEFFVGQRTV